MVRKLPPLSRNQSQGLFETIPTQILHPNLAAESEPKLSILAQDESLASLQSLEMLATMKPVWKNNYFHQLENVILTFKSMEIQLGGHTKIYVPLDVVRDMYSIPAEKEEDLIKILFSSVKS